MNDPIRILIIDDHLLFRESLVRLLNSTPGLRVVAHCSSLSEAERLLQNVPLDVVLLDYDLGLEVGTDFLGRTNSAANSVKVLMVTAGMRPAAALKAVDSGVSGAVLKHSEPVQLIEAIRRVASGEKWWDTNFVRGLAVGSSEHKLTANRTRPITERQRIVLKNILNGLTNKEIAAQLGVSEAAVEATIQELFSKSGVKTRSQLVREAIERYSSEWLTNPEP